MHTLFIDAPSEIVTPEQMRDMDRYAIEEVGIAGVVLMERAALGAVVALREHFGVETVGRVGILCGGGNNGGDGFAMARILALQGVDVMCVLLSATRKLQGDAKLNYQWLKSFDVFTCELGEDSSADVQETLAQLAPCDVWCDAMLGTGIDRDVTGRYAEAIQFFNAQPRRFCVDIPSGINGANGATCGVACQADATATFGLPKYGHALYPGRQATGKLYCIDIGLPRATSQRLVRPAIWPNTAWATSKLRPREVDFHKGRAGRVFVIGGSREKTGAVLLAARGALEAGAGLVTVGTTDDVVPLIAQHVPEVMAERVIPRVTKPNENLQSSEAVQNLEDLATKSDALTMGPGLGVGPHTKVLLQTLFRLAEKPSAVVMDADALNGISAFDLFDELRNFASSRDVVLTPHPGEMARLCKAEVSDILATPLAFSKKLAEQTQCIVVLKIATTITTDPAGRVAINSSGNPGMASGGTGDALSGIMTGLLAEGAMAAFDAATLAVYVHGLAGDFASERYGERALTASKLIDALHGAFDNMATP